MPSDNRPPEGSTVEVRVRGVVHHRPRPSSGFYVRPASCPTTNSAWIAEAIDGHDDITITPLALQVAAVEIVDVAPVPTVEEIQRAIWNLPRDWTPAELQQALYGRPVRRGY